jgi:branched-chain amino acid transport system ATP-binding protein
MLLVEDVHSYYGESYVLQGVSLTIGAGEAVCLLGRNGAGKTTTALTIMGYLKPRPGNIRFDDMDIAGREPYEIARLGLGFVPQERCIFRSLTVEENLTVAARKTKKGTWNLETVYKLFPRLKERGKNLGFQLSGGEQQMLSVARALMLNPRLLVLDEPSEGLAPLIIEEIVGAIRSFKREGLSLLLIEQNLRVALDLGDRHHVMSKGRIQFTGTSADIADNESVLKKWLSM